MKLVLNNATGNLTVIRYGKQDGTVFVETNVFMPANEGVSIEGAPGFWWWASTSAPLGDVDEVLDGDYLKAPLLPGMVLLTEEDLKAEIILMKPAPELLSHFQQVLNDNKADLNLVATLENSKQEI